MCKRIGLRIYGLIIHINLLQKQKAFRISTMGFLSYVNITRMYGVFYFFTPSIVLSSKVDAVKLKMNLSATRTFNSVNK